MAGGAIDALPVGRTDPAIEIEDLRIVPTSVEAYVGGIPAGLNVTEFRIVSHLARAPGYILLREQLFEAIWGRRPRREGRDQILKSQVTLIRGKFVAIAPSRKYIEVRRTAFGVTYAIEPGERVTFGNPVPEDRHNQVD